MTVQPGLQCGALCGCALSVPGMVTELPLFLKDRRAGGNSLGVSEVLHDVIVGEADHVVDHPDLLGSTARVLNGVHPLVGPHRPGPADLDDRCLNVVAIRADEELSMTRIPTGESDGNDSPEKVRAGSIDSGHLLLAGPGPALAWPLPAASLPGATG